MQDSSHQDELEAFPVSPAQVHHLRTFEASPSSNWTTTGWVRIEGALDTEKLACALQTLAQRHEILRTTYRMLPGTRTWTQVIEPAASPLRIDVRDLRGLPDHEVERGISALDMDQGPWDISSQAPLRVALARLQDDEHLLLLSQPAVANDLAGLELLVSEIADALAGRTPAAGDVGPMQFADIAQFLCDAAEGEDLTAEREHWRRFNSVETFEQRLALEFDRGAESGCLYSVNRPLNGEVVEQLRAFAQTTGIAPATVYLAAWQILLSRQAETERVITGVLSAGRSYEGLETALGRFARFLPVATPIATTQTFEALCKDLEQQVSLSENAHEAFHVDTLEDGSPHVWPFAFEHRSQPATLRAGELSFQLEQSAQRSESARLQLTVAETEHACMLRFDFDSRFLPSAAAGLLAEQFETLLCNALSAVGTTTEEISFLPAAQERTLLDTFARSGPGASGETRLVHQRFVERAAAAPGTLAVTAEGRGMTYGELDELSDRIACALQSHALEAGSFVGLYIERSAEMIAAILGTLKAGLAYLPLPPDYPQERVEFMLHDAEARCVLTRSSEAAGLAAFAGHVICIDKDIDRDGEPETPRNDCRSDLTAYAIYTSGSTGKPKGVPISHANLAHSTEARLVGYGEPVGAFLLLSSFAFDSSVAGIFWTLAQGGTLVLPPADFEKDIPALADEIQRAEVTHLLGLPSLWNAILATSDTSKLGSLRTVIVAGESCLPEWIEHHRTSLPRTALFNEYGPTEATVWSTVFDCLQSYDRARVPIGRPIRGAEVFVVGANGALAPIGVAGELHIGGAGVASGYHNRPDLTAEKFVPHRFGGDGRLYRTGDRVRFLPDGNLEFLGRIDQQVKIRGYRIELEEIEAALASHSDVQEAVVVAAQRATETQLVAYVIPRSKDAFEERLRAHLGKLLPDYMIPALFVRSEAFPTLPNGKVDRRALETLDVAVAGANAASNETTFEAPRTQVEKVLAVLWRDLLNKPDISRNDDFFQLGGHSILATQLFARIVETLGVKIRLRALFEERRLEAIATGILEQADDPAKVERRAEIALQILELTDDEAETALGA